MAQTYTLDEAAKRLGITPDVLKRRLKEDWKNLRAFRDGSTLRFRTSDVDELARSLGEVSDPSLQLAPLDDDPLSLSSGDFEVPVTKKAPPPPVEEPLIFDLSSDESISFEEPKPTKAKGDSDVRLEEPKSRVPSKDEATDIVDLDLDLDIDGAGPGSAIIREGSAARLTPPRSSTKLSAADSNKNIDKPNLSESSEFELSLEADSDDFELQINEDSSENEVILGDVSKKPGGSGINLRDPKDSGINLEGKSGKPKSGVKLGKPSKPVAPEPSDDDFELSLDPPVSSSPGSGRSGKLPPITSSDSEFELSLDDPSSGDDSLMAAVNNDKDEDNNDIFETDFEIPALDDGDESGSSAKLLEDSDSQIDTDQESSDFDLALDSSDIEAEDESASQVVVLEDDSEPDDPKPRRRPNLKKRGDDESDDALSLDPSVSDIDVDAVEVEEDEDVAGALQGVRGRSRVDDDEDEDEDEEESRSAPAAPVQWGVLPAIFLAPAFLVLLLGGLIGYEMLHTMWGYHQPRPPGAPIVRGLAETFDMPLKDQ